MATGRGPWKQLKWLCYGFLLGLVAWLSWQALRQDLEKEGFISLDSFSSVAGLADTLLGTDLSAIADIADQMSELQGMLGDIMPTANCDKTMIGSKTVWLCPDDDKATAVAKSNPADATCVPNGMTPATFYCNDAYMSDREQAAAAGYGIPALDMLRKDHERLCRELYKNYFDISGNANAVAKINGLVRMADQSLLIDMNGVKEIRAKLACGAGVVSLDGITDPVVLQNTKVCNKSFQTMQALERGRSTIADLNTKLNDTSAGPAPLVRIKQIHALLGAFVKQFNCR